MQEYYDAHDWTVDGVEGKAPLADVKANVKTALRTEATARGFRARPTR